MQRRSLTAAAMISPSSVACTHSRIGSCKSEIVVGIDYDDFRTDARRFAKRNGMTYPLVYDRGGDMAERYGLKGVPETFFIDREGRLVGEPVVGGIDARDELREQFEAGLAEILS